MSIENFMQQLNNDPNYVRYRGYEWHGKDRSFIAELEGDFWLFAYDVWEEYQMVSTSEAYDYYLAANF